MDKLFNVLSENSSKNLALGHLKLCNCSHIFSSQILQYVLNERNKSYGYIV